MIVVEHVCFPMGSSPSKGSELLKRLWLCGVHLLTLSFAVETEYVTLIPCTQDMRRWTKPSEYFDTYPKRRRLQLEQGHAIRGLMKLSEHLGRAYDGFEKWVKGVCYLSMPSPRNINQAVLFLATHFVAYLSSTSSCQLDQHCQSRWDLYEISPPPFPSWSQETKILELHPHSALFLQLLLQ